VTTDDRRPTTDLDLPLAVRDYPLDAILAESAR
jgi:hypothetical protein